MNKKEKIEILTDAYKDAEEKINEAYIILEEAHDETDTKIDHYIKQELDSDYMSSLAQQIIDKEEADGWDDEFGDEDEKNDDMTGATKGER